MRTEIIVVGAGPTGLMLAYELTLAKVPVVVLEKQRIRNPQSRAGSLQPRTAEVLDLRGLLQPLLDHTLPREEVGGHFAGLPVELDCRPWRTRYPYPVGIPQARLEAHLETQLVSRGVPVLRGREVSSVKQDADGVTVEDIRGSYLAACDGGHSTVRRILGVPFPGRDGRLSAVVADITLATRSATVPVVRKHFSQHIKTAAGYFGSLLPIEGDLYRLMFGKLSGQGPEREAPITDAEVSEALKAVYGQQTELGEVREASRFSDASRQLECYRSGRVLFAGDAAHIHLPIGGQGVNLGIQDAFNLGWKLAATVNGWAPDALLDTYHTERHPIAARVLHNTRAQSVIVNPGQDENVGALRDMFIELLRLPDANRLISGIISGLAVEAPGLGPRMVDVELTTSSGPTRVSSLMHAGRGLLLSLDGRSRSVEGWADRVDYVTATSDEEIDAVLVRPDGHIAWSGADGEALEAALSRWFGEPRTRPSATY